MLLLLSLVLWLLLLNTQSPPKRMRHGGCGGESSRFIGRLYRVIFEYPWDGSSTFLWAVPGPGNLCPVSWHVKLGYFCHLPDLTAIEDYIDTVKDTGSLTSCAFVKEHSSSSRISTVGTFFTVLYEACPLLHASSMWTQQWHMAPVRIRGRDGATLAYTWVMNERGASRTSSKSNLVLC